MERVMTKELLEQYQDYLFNEEKEAATIEKYMRDLKKFTSFTGEQELNKSLVIAYKNYLREQGYKISSINSFLVAVNRFFIFAGWHELRVKAYRKQREVFCAENRHLTKAEYQRLVRTASKNGRDRLAMILQTICATGIRISELTFVTVESVYDGMMEIHCKGKLRTVLFPKRLQKLLKKYISKNEIGEGYVFCTSGGKPVDRSNVWREMKTLCKEAGVDEEKVFPHNLRHLFAQVFYEIKKDIAKLADILGHSSIETTRIYMKTSSREHRKQLEMMGLVLEI
ncbi:MAG: site-specific integrase [Muribaculaceae bacterium]|nr:site-specific integrase [Roseburia sp.]MCM1431240.1 site-specific integrase [Muribaculaceae bacterium]MCM1492274.1 site-specific integrase [Muribaculaceae bacterium]